MNLILFSCVLLVCSQWQLCHAGELKVDTQYGKIEGFRRDGVDCWWGVPFASPPTGALRFQAPTPPQAWSKTLPTKHESKICAQLHLDGEFNRIFIGEEDCLYMDIYRPEHDNAGSNLPVLLFIHGGGFNTGWTRGAAPILPFSDIYDGKKIAKQHNQIVVSINYRLGVFGFLALDALLEESPVKSTGNYGMMDQRMALKFVKDNIANFGGDKDRITIFGESAGGTSMCYHLVSPTSKGLFNGVIGESPLCLGSAIAFEELKVAVNFGNLYTQFVKCNETTTKGTLDCLRSKPTRDILDYVFDWKKFFPDPTNKPKLPTGIPIFPWWPVVDGSPEGMPEQPLKLLEKGEFSKVPVILGTNHDEGTIFLPVVALAAGVALPLNAATFKTAVEHVTNNLTEVDEVLKAYPANNYKSEDVRAEVLLRDFFLACPARRTLREMNKWYKAHSQTSNNYLYMFDRHWMSIAWPIVHDMHGSELPYVFNHDVFPFMVWDSTDWDLSHEMGSYWAALARDGTPNGAIARNCSKCINWPKYTATGPTDDGGASDENMAFDKKLHVDAGLYASHCDFWDRMGYNR